MPNLLTMGRIAIIPVVLWLLDNGTPHDCLVAAFVYSAAAFTDLLDGYLARRMNIVSVLGKFLDPLADKLLVMASLVWMVPMGRIPEWAVALLLAREISITGLRSIASSGEIARVMLAIKTILSDADQVPVLVFDEIDANIGGRVAADVAAELRTLGRQHQVFCITHLPRIAAAGEAHFLVSKQINSGRTNASMLRLEGEDRVQEIVRMLGDSGSSATACRHARELLAEMSA